MFDVAEKQAQWRRGRDFDTVPMSSLPPIFIMDDAADDLFILKRLLEKAEIKNKTVSFEDPTAAVACLQAEIAPRRLSSISDVRFFTDLNMPRMAGVEFTSGSAAGQITAHYPTQLSVDSLPVYPR